MVTPGVLMSCMVKLVVIISLLFSWSVALIVIL